MAFASNSPGGVCSLSIRPISRTGCAQGEDLVKRMDNKATLQGSALIRQVMQILCGLSCIPADGCSSHCSSAAQVLLSHLEEADTVSLCTYTESCPTVCLLAGAAGLGQRVIQQQLIMSGSDWAPSLCCMHRSPFLYRTVVRPEDADNLPQDWAALHQQAGLRTFLAAQVTVAGDNSPGVVGVLCLASKRTAAFMDDSWDLLLSMVATGLVPLLTSPWLSGLSGLAASLVDIASFDGFAGFAAAFLQGAAQLLEATNYRQLGVRLGLLSEDAEELLLLQTCDDSCCKVLQSGEQLLICGDAAEGHGLGCYGSLHLGLQQLHMTRLSAAHTKLIEAIRSGSTCLLVSDTQALVADLETAPLDLLVADSNPVGSTIVVPLFAANGQALGGLYISHEEAGDCLQSGCIREQCSMLQALLQQELVELDVNMEGVQCCTSPLIRTVSSVSTSSCASSLSCSTMSSFSSRTAELGVLRKVWRLQDQQAACVSGYLQELQLHSVLGVGGFSTVYAGLWHGSKVAVKVMRVSQNDLLGIPAKSAVEMAALSTLRHPNIVSSYACLTDMVQERASPGSSSSAPIPSLSLRQLLNTRFREATAADQEDPSRDLFNIIVMERCDRGNLWDAVGHEGLLHRRLPDGRLRVSMGLLYSMLLDVAAALKYMHSLGLVHLDVKASNVLLQTASGRPNGLPVAKLGDFGLVKLLGTKGYLINHTTSGTLTHLAPERLQSGSLLTAAADVYGFGILMYELYTGSKPYAGLSVDKRLMKLIYHGLRPQFPASTPPAYRALAEACWSQNMAERPTFDSIMHQLQEQFDHTCKLAESLAAACALRPQ